MKKACILAALSLTTLPVWAGVGKHNFLASFNFGAGIYHDSTAPGSWAYGFPGIEASRGKAYFGFDIGYLLHSVRESGTIHGMDLRLGIIGDVPTGGYSGTSFRSFQTLEFSNPLLLTLSVGYTPGHKFGSFRLLFDVVGMSISFAFANTHNVDTGENRSGVFMGFVYTLPLGMHFLLNNGSYFSVRHQIIINPYAVNSREPVAKYALLFGIGYAFGK